MSLPDNITLKYAKVYNNEKRELFTTDSSGVGYYELNLPYWKYYAIRDFNYDCAIYEDSLHIEYKGLKESVKISISEPLLLQKDTIPVTPTIPFNF